MTTCTRGGSGIAGKVVRQVQARLQELPRLYPGTNAWAILVADTGDVLLESAPNATASLLAPALQIARAASAFSATLDDADDAEIVHVFGARCAVTFARCFPGGAHALLFFAATIDGNGEERRFCEGADADTRLRELCADVHHLIASVHQPATPTSARAPSALSSSSSSSHYPPTPTVSPHSRRGFASAGGSKRP